MKNLKTTIIAATLAFCCFTPTNAQNAQSTPIKGISVKAGHNPKPTMMVSLNANGGTSSSTGVDTGLSFNPSLGIAIHWKNFGIGLDAGMFNTQPNFDFDAYTAPLQNLDFLTITNTKSDWTSTYFMLGPEYTIPLNPSPNKESGRHTPFHNKLTFTVALKGGLTLNKAPEFSVMDSNTPPKSIASYTAPQDYKANAFSLKPSIGFAYWINENFALTANAQYLIQTGQQEFTTGYRDLSNVNLAPPVSPIQFQEAIATAPKVMTTTKGPENYMSFGFGVTYSLRKGWNGSIKGNKTVETSSSNQKQRPCDCCHEIHGKGLCPNGCDMATSANVVDSKDLVLADSRKDVKNATSEVGVKAVAENSSPGNTDNQKQRPCDCCHEIHGKGLCPNGCDMATSANVVDSKDLVLADSGKDVKNATSEVGVKAVAENSSPGNTDNQKQRPCKCCQGFHSGKCPNGCDMATSANVVDSKDLVLADSGKDVKNATSEVGVKAVAENSSHGNTDNQKQRPCKCCQGFHSGKCPNGCDMATSANVVDSKDLVLADSGKNVANEAEIKQIAETLINYRKGVEGKNTANVKAIAETLVNLARKGWDGSIKGNKIESVANEADVKAITETLVNIRKGWDGSIKGNYAESAANEADVKAISETFVNLRKGYTINTNSTGKF